MKLADDLEERLSSVMNRRTPPTAPRADELADGNPEVVTHAMSVFGDRERALDWLRTPNHLFAGKSPEKFAKSGGGQEVERILTRIEYGVFS
jgi:uncharacterized protein (DUF2384 family)